VTDVFLGVIAVAVLVMAIIQVAAIVFAMSAARRIGAAADRLEQDLRPVMSNLQAITAEAARATSLATAQMERADRMFADLSRRAEQVMAGVPSLVGSAGKGLAFLNGIKAALAALQEVRRSSRRGAAHPDEEDALFIG
jgi:outer membrane murein-binding lipoprotein Lpp